MKISLCMIVKNEGKYLARCLRSVQEYVEEIIVVDTGSTDGTKAVAAQFTEHIFDYEWCNDFSKARNFSISKASFDWILILDADEIVTGFSKPEIINFMKNHPNTVGRITIVNSFESSMFVEQKITERINRFFPKHAFIYDGLIHEQIVRRDGKPYDTLPIGITIDHIGYTKEVMEEKGKLGRNIDLLKQALAKQPQDPYLNYQLGKSHYTARNLEEACRYFEISLELKPDIRYEYVQNLVESYGYTLINLQRSQEAMRLLDYQTYYGGSPDYMFLLGNVFLNNAMLSKAAEYFIRCTELSGGKAEGITTFLPHYNIGVIFECLGYHDQAIQYYNKCGNYAPAKARLELEFSQNP